MAQQLHSVPGGLAITKRDVRNALETPRDAYPFSTTCAVCGNVWAAHMGKLCPAGNEKDRQRDLMHLVAMGEVSVSSIDHPRFQWRGTFFIPLLDCNEVERVTVDLGRNL